MLSARLLLPVSKTVKRANPIIDETLHISVNKGKYPENICIFEIVIIYTKADQTTLLAKTGKTHVWSNADSMPTHTHSTPWLLIRTLKRWYRLAFYSFC